MKNQTKLEKSDKIEKIVQKLKWEQEKFVWWCTFLFHFENTGGCVILVINADKL